MLENQSENYSDGLTNFLYKELKNLSAVLLSKYRNMYRLVYNQNGKQNNQIRIYLREEIFRNDLKKRNNVINKSYTPILIIINIKNYRRLNLLYSKLVQTIIHPN